MQVPAHTMDASSGELAGFTTGAPARMRIREQADGGISLWLVVLGLATMGFNQTRIGGWTISDLIFLAAACAVCFQLLMGGTTGLAPNAMRKTSPSILLGTLVLVVAGTASSLQAFDPVPSVMQVVSIVWITLAWFWLLRAVCPNRRALSRILTGVSITVYVSCAGAIAGYFGIVSLTEDNLEGREAAFFNHPNELGGLLSMALPIVVLGAFRFGRSRPRGAVLRRALAIAVVVFAMNATGSITALIAGATGLVAAGALNVFTLNTTVFRRFRNPLPVMLGILLALLLVVWVAASDLPVTERFGELGEDGSGPSASIDVRKELIAGVTDHFDQFLVTGRGLDSVVIIDGLPGEHRVHNLYLRLIYEAGIPALVGLGAILVTVVRQSWLLAIDTRASELNRVVVGLFGAFVSMLTFALFQPVLAQRFFWLPIALVGVVWALRRQELRDDASGHGAHDPRRVP